MYMYIRTMYMYMYVHCTCASIAYIGSYRLQVLISLTAVKNWVHVQLVCSMFYFQDVLTALAVLHDSICQLVSLYCISLYPGYLPHWSTQPQVTLLSVCVCVCVCVWGVI